MSSTCLKTVLATELKMLAHKSSCYTQKSAVKSVIIGSCLRNDLSKLFLFWLWFVTKWLKPSPVKQTRVNSFLNTAAQNRMELEINHQWLPVFPLSTKPKSSIKSVRRDEWLPKAFDCRPQFQVRVQPVTVFLYSPSLKFFSWGKVFGLWGE